MPAPTDARPNLPRFRTYADDLPPDADAARTAYGESDRRPETRRWLRPLLIVALVFLGAAALGFLVPLDLFQPRPGPAGAARPATAPATPLAPSEGLQVEVAAAPSPASAPPAAPAVTAPVRPSPPPAEARGDPAATRVAPAEPIADGPVRVFVHVAETAQRSSAERARTALGRMRVGGQPVGAPPLRIVGRTPGRTELRCLKRADCAAATVIARGLSRTLGTPVPVVDMSSRYEADGRIRAGTLELWLRD